MKDLKELVFKNLKEVAAIVPPKCEEHGEDTVIGLEEYNLEELLQIGVDILHDFDKEGAALVLMDKEESKALYPISAFDKDREEHSTVGVAFADKEDLIKNGKIEEYKIYVANKFNEMVAKNNIKTILVLEQDKDDERLFKFVY